MTTKVPVELSSTPGIVDNSNATAITIDSSENIGIGTSSPASNQGFGKTVEISDAGATTGPDLMLTNPTAGTDEFLGQLSFNHANDALAAINAKTDGATDAGHIQFQTQKTSGALAERLRISGNNLHLNGGTDARIQLGSGGAGANQVSNNTVHIRGDGTNMKLMAASGGAYQFETNGTEVFKIDSAGIVTKPLQPYFLAYRSSSQSGYNATSYTTVIEYNAEVDDTNGDFNTSTGLFTAPVDGTYWFIASAYANFGFQQSWLVINTGSGASRASYTDFNVGGYSGAVFSGVFFVNLDANDTVGYHPYTSASSSVLIYSNANHTWFKGGLLY